MPKVTEYRCPDCGGTNIQDLIMTWVDPNTRKDSGEWECPDLYPDLKWCNDCDKNPGDWEVVEVDLGVNFDQLSTDELRAMAEVLEKIVDRIGYTSKDIDEAIALIARVRGQM